MSFRGKKVVVTGADGFIGSHLAEELVRKGADVTALALYTGLDRFGWLDEIDDEMRNAMRIVRGDVRDGAMMARLLGNVDIVFHLAALIAIPHSYDAPSSYIDVNVTGTVNILEAARMHHIGRVIHTSTSEVYGTAQTVPISESHPLVAQSPYAASKIAADKLAESYALCFNLPVFVLRPFNTYGPRQSERAVISATIRQALDPRSDAIHIGDPNTIRDFNYISDTVAAFVAIGSSDAVEPGRPYNSGTGIGTPISKMIELVRAATGTNKTVVSEARRVRPEKSEIRELVADPNLFRKATGWKPAVDLTCGIATMVDWWRERIEQDRVRADVSYIV